MLLCCIVADSTKGRSRVKVPFLSFFFRLSHLDWLACVSGGGPVGHGDSCFSLFSFCPVLSQPRSPHIGLLSMLRGTSTPCPWAEVSGMAQS